MKKILLIIISLVLLNTGTIFAECPMGKTEITIVNPAGKAIEICVPDAAIPGIETSSENSDGTVIPAVCPCFTQEDLEAYNATCAKMKIYPDLEGGDGRVETKVNTDNPPVVFGVGYRSDEWGASVAYGINGVNSICTEFIFPLYINFCTSESGIAIQTSLEEAQACHALLKGTYDWYQLP